MNHHSRVGKSRSLARSSGSKKDAAHRCCHACADSRHIRRNELHGIVNTQTSRYRTTGRIDINLNILRGIYRLQKKQLRLNNVGHIVIYGSTKEYDTIHHKTREHIHGGHIQMTLLDNCRRDISRLYRIEIVKFQATDAIMSTSIFFKFIHTLNMIYYKPKFGLCKHYAQSPNFNVL